MVFVTLDGAMVLGNFYRLRFLARKAEQALRCKLKAVYGALSRARRA